MQLFADLLDALSYQPARNGKLRLIEDYLRHAPDPDRGYALAALCGELELPSLKPAALRDMTMARVDPELFGWSYDYVGDLAETIALIWPGADKATHVPPRLSDVIERLRLSGRAEAMMLMAGWLDGLDATGRWALLKLAAGALRVGVSARLAKTALAGIGSVGLEEIEELWPQHEPPYTALINWVTGGEKPAARNTLGFRPLMLSHPIEEADFANLAPHDFCAEWKWDGIRVQVAAGGGQTRLYSRAGEDISGAFPDLIEQVDFEAVLDGELLVAKPIDGEIEVASFNDLQQRLNRKKPSPALVLSNPAHVRLYDALIIGNEDLRPLPLRERRQRLEAWYGETIAAALRPVAADPVRGLERACAPARRCARRRHRGPDAEALGEPLHRRPRQGPLVQVEARRPHHRRGADVCPARARQALVLLFRFHLRLLAARWSTRPARPGASWCRWARPIPASPTRS